MKALVLTPPTREVHLRDIPRPIPAAGEVLVRVHAIALNPVDSLYVAHPIARNERVIGTDFAGVVVETGPGMETADARAQIGARVVGFLQGGKWENPTCSTNDRPGAFAEYVTAPYDLLWTVPATTSLADAAAVSMCGLTAAQGVFYRLDMPCPFASTEGFPPSPSDDPVPVLIYGASTSLGLYAAQLVRLAATTAGRRIQLIGTASRSKHEFLSAPPYGYDLLLDYRDPGWCDAVRAAVPQGVMYALDTITEGATVTAVDSVLSPNARFAVFRGPDGGGYDPAALRVAPVYGAAWEGLGVEIGYNGAPNKVAQLTPDSTLPASPAARDFAARFFAYLNGGGGSLRLQPNPVRRMPGGLARVVPDGFALLGDNQVSTRAPADTATLPHMRPISGEKLVYVLVDE